MLKYTRTIHSIHYYISFFRVWGDLSGYRVFMGSLSYLHLHNQARVHQMYSGLVHLENACVSGSSADSADDPETHAFPGRWGAFTIINKLIHSTFSILGFITWKTGVFQNHNLSKKYFFWSIMSYIILKVMTYRVRILGNCMKNLTWYHYILKIATNR